MQPLVIGLPENDALTTRLVVQLAAQRGAVSLHVFPDGETSVRVDVAVRGRVCVLVCGLDRPNEKALPFYLTASTLRDLGATRILLVAPYLPYMRQDTAFREGEGVSARYFARWLSSCVDGLVTVDPHLHRIRTLADIYSIPTREVASAPAIARWIRTQVPNAVLIGPDGESEQWVSSVARDAECPYTVLAKVRRGDHDVETTLPDVAHWYGRPPVLVDDIISTARTMIATLGRLQRIGMTEPVCVGVHAVFAGSAYADLIAAGASRVVTCNTIVHASNAIDVHDRIADAVAGMLAHGNT